MYSAFTLKIKPQEEQKDKGELAVLRTCRKSTKSNQYMSSL